MITIDEKKVSLTDFHSHILPGFDDGAGNSEETRVLLDMSAEQGIDKIVATPHFYTDERSLDSYLEKRDSAVKELLKVYDRERHPRIALGAEVAYFTGMDNARELSRLAVKGTDVILVELPFTKWDDRMFKDLDGIRYKLGLEPIIAHIERYQRQGSRNIKRLMKMEFFLQCNAELFADPDNKRFASKIIKTGAVGVLGSDMHNTDDRRQTLGESVPHIMEYKYGRELLISASQMSARFLKNAELL